MAVRGVSILVLTLAYATATAAASERPGDAQTWLEKMGWAVQMLNYEGTFVYQYDDKLETMQIAHMVDGEEEKERLLSLNGTPREVIRNNDTVMCIWPDSRSVVIEKRRTQRAFPVVLPEQLNKLKAHYRLESAGEQGRVAGKLTHRVNIEPKDGFRYGYQLWLDSDNALPLKADMVDENNKPVAQILFTSLRVYDHYIAEKVRPSNDGASFTRIRAQDREPVPMSGRSRWTIESLPPGFTMTTYTRQRLDDNGRGVEHMLFTDGLASFSVYIEAVDGGRSLRGDSRMGSVNAYGRTVGDYHVTVVGEVPATTVRLVGDSLAFREQEPSG